MLSPDFVRGASLGLSAGFLAGAAFISAVAWRQVTRPDRDIDDEVIAEPGQSPVGEWMRAMARARRAA